MRLLAVLESPMLHRPASPDCLEVSRCFCFGFDSVSRSEFQTLFEGWHLPFGKASRSRLSSPYPQVNDVIHGRRASEEILQTVLQNFGVAGRGGEGGTGGTMSKHQNEEESLMTKWQEFKTSTPTTEAFSKREFQS